jgi:hypothetical protein
MKQPVLGPDGYHYEAVALKRALQKNERSPLSNTPMAFRDAVEADAAFMGFYESWLKKNLALLEAVTVNSLGDHTDLRHMIDVWNVVCQFPVQLGTVRKLKTKIEHKMVEPLSNLSFPEPFFGRMSSMSAACVVCRTKILASQVSVSMKLIPNTVSPTGQFSCHVRCMFAKSISFPVCMDCTFVAEQGRQILMDRACEKSVNFTLAPQIYAVLIPNEIAPERANDIIQLRDLWESGKIIDTLELSNYFSGELFSSRIVWAIELGDRTICVCIKCESIIKQLFSAESNWKKVFLPLCAWGQDTVLSVRHLCSKIDKNKTTIVDV